MQNNQEQIAPLPTVPNSSIQPSICPFCHLATTPDEYFCHNCGKKLREKELSTTIGRQIYVYAISVLLPPAGIWWGVKYLRQEDSKSQKIGIAAIILTVASLLINLWFILEFYKSYTQKLNDSMQQINNLGI